MACSSPQPLLCPASLTNPPRIIILVPVETAFDPLKFYDGLKAADIPDKQARAQAEAIRSAFAAYDAGRIRDLSTKEDIQASRLEMREVELCLSEGIEAAKHEMLKWRIGLLITQSALLVAIFAFLN